MIRLFIKVLMREREKLQTVARANLLDHRDFSQELEQNRVLDASAIDVWNEMKEKGISLPEELHPGPLPSVYYVVDTGCRIEFLNELYGAGFKAIDGGPNRFLTPLLNLLIRQVWGWSNGGSLVEWFMHKNASLDFSFDWSFPTALFYFAIAHSQSLRGNRTTHTKTFLKDLVPLATSLCDPLLIDSCSCYCSSQGCLPAHKFWSCNLYTKDHQGCLSINKSLLDLNLEIWTQLCRLESSQIKMYYAEICRLEIFDRLGMAHTCCGYVDSEAIRLVTMKTENQSQLREEDVHLVEQLNLLMKNYNRLEIAHKGNFREFWRLWWARVDRILPELTPVERCRSRGLHRSSKDFMTSLRETAKLLSEDRCKIEEIALKENGFDGMKFKDVIDKHFTSLESLW